MHADELELVTKFARLQRKLVELRHYDEPLIA